MDVCWVNGMSMPFGRGTGPSMYGKHLCHHTGAYLGLLLGNECLPLSGFRGQVGVCLLDLPGPRCVYRLCNRGLQGGACRLAGCRAWSPLSEHAL